MKKYDKKPRIQGVPRRPPIQVLTLPDWHFQHGMVIDNTCWWVGGINFIPIFLYTRQTKAIYFIISTLFKSNHLLQPAWLFMILYVLNKVYAFICKNSPMDNSITKAFVAIVPSVPNDSITYIDQRMHRYKATPRHTLVSTACHLPACMYI